MVGILMIKMKLTVLRHAMSGTRAVVMGIGALLGLLLAGGTLWLGVLPAHNTTFALDLLSTAFLCWMLGWIVGPLLSSGDETLRAEQFRLLPLSPHRLATGLLGASFLGVGSAVTLLAFCALVVYAAPSGIIPTLVAVLALLLQWIYTMLLSHLITEALHAPTKSRLATELAALLLGLLLAFLFTGWTLFPIIGALGQLFESQPAPLFSTLMQFLPSGWGLVAVSAASRAAWLQVGAALAAQLVLCGLLFFIWGRLLTRHMTTAIHLPRTISALSASRRFLPTSALWAVVSKELHTWFRDPWRARFLRMGLWVGLFSCALPALSGWFLLFPWMGAIMIIIIGIPAGNLYAFDGSALWLTLIIPGATRVDIRGRQIAWLLLMAPTTLLLTIVLTLVSRQDWAWAWVLATLPALLGGTVGLLPLVSVFLLVPLTEPGKRGESPMVTGPNNGQITLQMRVMLLLIIVMALPASLVVLFGTILQLPALQWSGVLVGLATGILGPWWFGRLAYRRLEARGPELLNTMRHGTLVRSNKSKQVQAHEKTSDLPQGKAIVVGLLVLCGILLTLPQGLVPLILKLAGVHVRGWFGALYLAPGLQIPASIACLLLGLSSLLGAGLLVREHRRNTTSRLQ